MNLLRTKWWAPVVAIYAAARLVSFLLFLLFAQLQEENYWTAAKPGYFDFLNIWDVEWYQRIYTSGYPAELPLETDGAVKQNNWAFYAAFPFLIRLLNLVTGVEWKILAPLVATVFGFAFILVCYKLFALKLSAATSLWAVALISFSMASPILQVGYAESLQLLLIAAALYFFMQRKDLLLILALALAAVTRPGVLAFALMFLILAIVHRNERVERWRLIGLSAISGVLGFAWLLIAWSVTGRWDAYLATENAWRAGYTGSSSLQPMTGWFISANFHLGAGIGIGVALGLIGLVTYWMTTDSVKALGSELRIWSISYLAYLFVVFFPQSSTPRILFPAFPLLAAIAIASARQPKPVKAALIALSVAGQALWLWICWKYTAPDFTPP